MDTLVMTPKDKSELIGQIIDIFEDEINPEKDDSMFQGEIYKRIGFKLCDTLSKWGIYESPEELKMHETLSGYDGTYWYYGTEKTKELTDFTQVINALWNKYTHFYFMPFTEDECENLLVYIKEDDVLQLKDEDLLLIVEKGLYACDFYEVLKTIADDAKDCYATNPTYWNLASMEILKKRIEILENLKK